MKGAGLAYLAFKGVPTPVCSATGPTSPPARPQLDTDHDPARDRGTSFFSIWSEVRIQALLRGFRVG